MLKSKKTKPSTLSVAGLQSVKGEFSVDTDAVVISQLRGGRDLIEFSKMADTDPVCGAVMLALTQIFKSINWETYNDPNGILKQSLLNVNWQDNISDILSMLIYGHSVMETTLTDGTEGAVHWKKMHFRPQKTISDWLYNKAGDLKYVQQTTVNGEQIDIKAAKCLIFHSAKTQANPRGKSLFTNAYRDWYYKTNIEKIEAIGIERDLTGLPVLSAPENSELQDEKGQLNKVGQWAWKVVRDVKRNHQEGLVLPHGWEFSLIGSPGQRQFDLNDSINRYSSNIALSMLAQFLVLGVTNTGGSFALAKEQSGLFHMAIEGFAKGIANAVNSQFIGGTALQRFNGLADKPLLKPVGIERVDLNDLASFLGRLLKYNIITPDDKLEEFLRDRVALPERDNETSRVADVKLAYEDSNKPEDEDDEKQIDNPDTPDNKEDDK